MIQKNTITVSYTDIKKCFATHDWQEYLEKMPLDVKNYVLKYQKEKDRLRVLCGKLLLQKALRELKQEDLLSTIQVDEYKRPFVSKNIDFNISHSGDVVVLAISWEKDIYGNIGIDIEKKREVEYDEFKRVFTPYELESIRTAQNPIDQFFEYWTMKEAVMKADGRGFHLSPSTFSIQDKTALIHTKTWHLSRISIHTDYDCHLATEENKPTIKTTEIIF